MQHKNKSDFTDMSREHTLLKLNLDEQLLSAYIEQTSKQQTRKDLQLMPNEFSTFVKFGYGAKQPSGE